MPVNTRHREYCHINSSDSDETRQSDTVGRSIDCLSQAGIDLMIPEIFAVIAAFLIEQTSSVDGEGKLVICGS